MKKPYEIHSDFFKKMIASGWYENSEIILDSLPHHLEELPDNVKKFLSEIWYLTISYDAYYRSNGCIFLSTVLHNFGGNYIMVEHSQPDGLVSCYEYDRYDPLAQIHNWTNEDGESQQQTHYFHFDQIGISREMTDDEGNLVCSEYSRMDFLLGRHTI